MHLLSLRPLFSVESIVMYKKGLLVVVVAFVLFILLGLGIQRVLIILSES